jgi:hypothetical protein
METESFEVEINAGKLVAELVEITKRIDTLKKQRAEYQAAAAKGDAEAAKSLERTNLQLKNQEEAYRKTQAAARTFAGAQKQGVDTTNFANNSIKTNRELLKQLKAEYVSSKEPSAALQQNIANLTKVLNEQQTGMTKSVEKVSFLQSMYGKLVDYLKNAPGPIGAAARAFDGVGKAIAAGTGPVGIIIEVLKGLWDILQSNSETAAEIQSVMAGLSSVFSKVATDVVNFGKGFADALSNPKKLITDLGDLIKENIVNRFKSFGVIITAIQNKDLKGLADGFIQLGTGVEHGTDKIKSGIQAVAEYGQTVVTSFTKGYVAHKTMEAVEVTMAKLNSAMKRNSEEIERLNQKLKDKSLTEEQAAKIAAQIAAKEIENLQKVQKIKELELEQQRKRAAQNKTDAQAQADLIDKTTEAELAALKVKEAISNKQAHIEDMLREKKKQALEDAREQERVKIELMEDGLAKREAEFKLAFAVEEERLKEHNVSTEDIQKLHDTRLQAIRQQFYNEELADKIDKLNEQQQKDIEAAEKTITNEEEKQAEIKRIRTEAFNTQIALLTAAATADGHWSDEEKAAIGKVTQALKDLQEQTKNTQQQTEKKNEKSVVESIGLKDEDLAEAQKVLGQIQQGFQQIADTVSMYYSQRLDEIESTKQAELDAVDASTLSEKEKQKKKKEIEKKSAQEAYEIQLKQFKANKAVAIIQAIINTAQAVMSAFATAGNIYAAIAMAAVAAGTGAAQIALIAQQKPPSPPKFAKGVIGLPGPGTETSDSIQAYLSKGESVITAKATRRFAPVLAQMEMAVGNVPNYNYTGGHFATGVIGDGGFYARESVNNVQNNTTLREAIAQGFREAPQPVVSVQEITRVNNNVSRSVKVSEL